jgi:hypothetical protein
MWGEEDGNRIDVWTAPRTEGAEALLRIDMRNYDSACAARLEPGFGADLQSFKSSWFL